MAPKIAIQNLTKRFRNNTGGYMQALVDINVTIAEGEFFCIVGPSGCGKSTLLRIMAGLDTYTSGSIEISHDDPKRPLTSMVFQEHALYPWMTVIQNAEFGLDMAGMPKAERRAIVRPFLEKAGLARFENYYPHQLSGGMRQRVSLVRAFVSNPEVLLMDEPFAALDAQNKILLQNELMRIWDENRKAVIYITHSIDEALLLGDRVAIMTASPGRLKEIISVPFSRPRELFDIQGTRDYTEVSRHIWNTMETEVLNAKSVEERAYATR